MYQNKIKLSDIKQALLDSRFREKLPEFLHQDVHKFLSNPGCACNASIYRKILQHCQKELREYFPSKEYESMEEEKDKLSKNHWKVINCKITDLEAQLKSLPPGRKQIAVARYEDDVTVVVNELDVLF